MGKEHFKEPLPGEIKKNIGTRSLKSEEIVKEDNKSPKSFKNIKMKLSFDSSPELMYQCLTDDQRISFFTQSQARMERKDGGKFELFGGQITGTNTKLVENKEIHQDWRFQSWPSGHHSKVKIIITQGKGV